MKILISFAFFLGFSQIASAINVQQFSRSNSLTYETLEDSRSQVGHVQNDYKWLGTIGYSFVNEPLVVKNSDNSQQRSSILSDLQTIHFGFAYYFTPRFQLGLTGGYSFFDDSESKNQSVLNDVDVKAKFRVFQSDRFTFGLMPTLTIPLDNKEFEIEDSNGNRFGKQSLLSDNSFGYGLRLLGEWTFKRLQLIANLGYRYSEDAKFTDRTGFVHIDMQNQLYTGLGAYIPVNQNWGFNAEFTRLWSLPFNSNINPNEFLIGTSFGITRGLHGFASAGFGNLIGSSDSDGNDIRISGGIKFYFDTYSHKELKRPIRIDAAPKSKSDCNYQLFDHGNIGTVRFANNRYSLIYNDQVALESFVKSIKENLNIIERIEIFGHTSASASNQYNMKLSKKRALGVQQIFVDSGIPSKLISSSWQGESQLLDKSADSNAAEKNRRVEVKISFKDCNKNEIRSY